MRTRVDDAVHVNVQIVELPGSDDKGYRSREERTGLRFEPSSNYDRDPCFPSANASIALKRMMKAYTKGADVLSSEDWQERIISPTPCMQLLGLPRSADVSRTAEDLLSMQLPSHATTDADEIGESVETGFRMSMNYFPTQDPTLLRRTCPQQVEKRMPYMRA